MYWVLTRATQVMVEAQRLDGLYRGPIHGTFAMVVNGLVSLRSANRMQFFRKDFLLNVELASNAIFCYIIVNRWIGLRLDIICGCFIVSVAIFALSQRDKIDPELLAMTLQIVSDIIFLFSISFRMFAEVENFMTSSQRIIEYTQLDQEDDLEKPTDEKLAKKGWPMNGKIEFDQVSMRYREELEPSIRNLSFTAQAGMIVGIIGRTGSGKSSILQTLFRLVDPEQGTIKIDGIDITEVGLH